MQNVVVKVCKGGKSPGHMQKYSCHWEFLPQFSGMTCTYIYHSFSLLFDIFVT